MSNKKIAAILGAVATIIVGGILIGFIFLNNRTTQEASQITDIKIETMDRNIYAEKEVNNDLSAKEEAYNIAQAAFDELEAENLEIETEITDEIVEEDTVIEETAEEETTEEETAEEETAEEETIVEDEQKEMVSEPVEYMAPETYNATVEVEKEIESMFVIMYAQQNCNVREDSTTQSDKISSFNKGAEVSVTGKTKGENDKTWYQVQLSDGKIGYVSGSLLGENEPVVEKKAVATQSTPKASTSQSTSQPQASNSAPSSNDIDAMLDALGGQSMNMTYTETNYDTAYSGPAPTVTLQ